MLKGAVIGWAGTALVLTSYAFLVLPKVEAHTQATPIGWYEKADDHGWSIETIGFKTYADLFYGKVMPPDQKVGPSDTTLVVTKITNKSFEPDADTKLEEERGGFRFYIKTTHQD